MGEKYHHSRGIKQKTVHSRSMRHMCSAHHSAPSGLCRQVSRSNDGIIDFATGVEVEFGIELGLHI